MSPWQYFRSQSPRTRMLLGVGAIAWGTVGLYLSDTAEKTLGFEPTEQDKAALRDAVPKITLVDRDDKKLP